jgi:hypothetical protein
VRSAGATSSSTRSAFRVRGYPMNGMSTVQGARYPEALERLIDR